MTKPSHDQRAMIASGTDHPPVRTDARGGVSASEPIHPELLHQIVTRNEAIALGLKWFFNGTPCVHGHVSKRRTKDYSCLRCFRLKENERKKENRLQQKKKLQETFQICDRCKSSKPLLSFRHVSSSHPDWCVECRSKFLNNKRKQAKKNLRDRIVSQQTPDWADRSSIRAKYAEAKWMSTKTGIEHHVDHFYPLNGDCVSGLHVPQNLRVVPARENAKKGHALPKTDRLPL